MQDLALTEEALPVYTRCAIHALSAVYLNLICQLTTVPTFCQHVHEVRPTVCLSVRPSFHRSIYLSVCESIYCIYRSIYLSFWVFSPQVIESRKKLVPFLLPEDVLVESSK